MSRVDELGRVVDEAGVANALPAALTVARGTLVFGEVHGTCQIPKFIADVVTALVARAPVVLALELRADQTPSIPAFLASDGGDAARAAMLRDAWWQGPWFDGRSSAAMLALLETARQLIASGAALEVLCFDVARPPSYEIAADVREAGMARVLIACRAARPDAIFVVLAGNLHTRRIEHEAMPGLAWMAMQLARAGVAFTSLAARYRSGTAWLCREDAASGGVESVTGVDGTSGIHLVPSDGHDGWFDVGPITASPPAVR